MSVDGGAFDGVALEVIAVTLQVFAFLDTVLTVSLVIGIAGLLLLLVGGTAIVRAHRRPRPDKSTTAPASDVEPVVSKLKSGQ